MSQRGAERLKEKLEAYWRERGYDISVVLREATFHASIRSTRFDLRSDMLNGYPRRRAETFDDSTEA